MWKSFDANIDFNWNSDICYGIHGITTVFGHQTTVDYIIVLDNKRV